MSVDMVVDAAERQFEAADAVLEAWRPAPAPLGRASVDANVISYVENAILVFLDRRAILRTVVNHLHYAAKSGQNVSLLQLWHSGSSLFRRALTMAAPLKDLIELTRTEMDPVRVEQFLQAIRELEDMVNDFRRQFPLGSTVEIAEERAAIAAKEYKDADQAFAAMAGVSMAEWQRRMEKQ
jgi:hypothetical protein